jgi:hypothetical protein
VAQNRNLLFLFVQLKTQIILRLPELQVWYTWLVSQGILNYKFLVRWFTSYCVFQGTGLVFLSYLTFKHDNLSTIFVYNHSNILGICSDFPFSFLGLVINVFSLFFFYNLATCLSIFSFYKTNFSSICFLHVSLCSISLSSVVIQTVYTPLLILDLICFSFFSFLKSKSFSFSKICIH